MAEIIIFSTALIATAIGLAVFRRIGRSIGMLDIPNERSSHAVPTLRGGGVVVVTVCLGLYLFITLSGTGQVNLAFVAGAIIVAAVSWVDDKVSLPASIKFAAHFAAAAILVAGTGSFPYFDIPGYGVLSVDARVFAILSFLWVVWMINAYNFMDGIDGIAGAQAVVAGFSWAAAGILSGDDEIYLFSGALAFSSLGFLIHNWSPARVFLGDVGSAFLGYTFAALPLIARKEGADLQPWLFAAAVSFVWLFAFDTIFTLAGRVLRREKIWIAHRKHLYQRLVISGWTHARVSLLYALSAALISSAFLMSMAKGGIWTVLLLFLYVAAPIAASLLAFRKNV